MNGYIQSRNGNDGTISGIYRSQGILESGALKDLIIRASGFINNDDVRYHFIKNAEAFTEAQLECINGDSSLKEKNLALSYLRQEQEYLEQQILWLDSKQVKPAASVEIKIINGMLSYIVKSIGLIGGVLQFAGGLSLMFLGTPTVVGSVVGGVLVLHGITNISENFMALVYDDNKFEGPATWIYSEIAESLGMPRSYGKLAFAGIDLTLSAYALFSPSLIPDMLRLFRYIPSDYEMSFRMMTAWQLSKEVIPDLATSYSGTQTFYSILPSEPGVPSNPLLSFPID